MLECGHIFCKVCVGNWSRRTRVPSCFVCKKPFKTKIENSTDVINLIETLQKRSQPKKVKKPCNFLIEGDFCPKGTQCPFEHNLKLIPCKKALEGLPCHKGKLCKFNHNKNIPCKLFKTPQGCPYGTKCRYRHEESPKVVCNFYIKGYCKRGAQCAYLHKTIR